MTYQIKALTLGEKFLVFGTSIEEQKIYSFECEINDYVYTSESLKDYEKLFKNNLQNFVTLFKIKIINQLAPMIVKEGYEHKETIDSNQSEQQQQHRSNARTHYFPPYHPHFPSNDPSHLIDPYSGVRLPPVASPFYVGGNDLFPSGGGRFPLPGIADPGGGNLVGPNHPAFGPRVRDPYVLGPRSRGSGGYRGPPPGARFDPYGPPNNDFSDINPDEPPPPGFDNMFL